MSFELGPEWYHQGKGEKTIMICMGEPSSCDPEQIP